MILMVKLCKKLDLRDCCAGDDADDYGADDADDDDCGDDCGGADDECAAGDKEGDAGKAAMDGAR